MVKAYFGWVQTVCQVHWSRLYSMPACLLHLQAAHVPPVSASCICSICTDSDSTKNFTFWNDLILSQQRKGDIQFKELSQYKQMCLVCFTSVTVGSQDDHLPAWWWTRPLAAVYWYLLQAGQTEKKHSTQYRTLLQFVCCWSQLPRDANWSPPGILHTGTQRFTVKYEKKINCRMDKLIRLEIVTGRTTQYCTIIRQASSLM